MNPTDFGDLQGMREMKKVKKKLKKSEFERRDRETVYTVTLWGLAFLLRQNASPHNINHSVLRRRLGLRLGCKRGGLGKSWLWLE